MRAHRDFCTHGFFFFGWRASPTLLRTTNFNGTNTIDMLHFLPKQLHILGYLCVELCNLYVKQNFICICSLLCVHDKKFSRWVLVTFIHRIIDSLVLGGDRWDWLAYATSIYHSMFYLYSTYQFTAVFYIYNVLEITC